MTSTILASVAHRLLLHGIALLLFVSCGFAATSNRQYDFRGVPDGANPTGRLVSDEAGNLYGTTFYGGIVRQNDSQCGLPGSSCGTIFKLAPNQHGGYTESVIYEFTGDSDGAAPQGKLVFDSSGNLYGTAQLGGILGCYCGTVFKLTPQPDGTWKETTIYNFHSLAEGIQPSSGVIFDAQGNLYGAAATNTIFELTPGQNGTWTASVIYTFLGGQDGTGANVLTFDSNGNLFGTTVYGGITQHGCGGTQGCGTVFELSPSASGVWTKSILYSFNDGLDGGYALGGVTFDKGGNLYGETTSGGSLACPQDGCGTIFRLTPQVAGPWKFSVVHTFNGLFGAQGQTPYGGLTFDSRGALYGTTMGGGDPSCFAGFGCGTVFKLTHSQGQHFSFEIITKFDSAHGSNPSGGVIIDSVGKLYGTAQNGGNLNCTNGCGVVFAITP